MSMEPSRKQLARRALVWLLLALPLLVALGLLVLFSYITWSSRNIEFVIRPQGLQIRGSLYGRTIPRDALLVEDARLVAPGSSNAMAVVRRTNGTSVPGFSEGWFRLADGRKALAFVTDVPEVVCVPTSQGYVVLLTPTRPDIFLATLKAATSAPVTFGIVPASFGAAGWLLAAALLPLLVLAPIVLVAVQQQRPVPQPLGPGVLYADRLIEITDDSILFRHYYFPVGSKRVMFEEIDRIEMFPLTLAAGSWRIWGTGGLLTWFPADWNRPNRSAGFRLYRKGKRLRIGFTAEDEPVVETILRRKGLLNAS